MSRVIGHVGAANLLTDGKRSTPMVSVVWHGDEPPHRVDGALSQCVSESFGVLCKWNRDEPPEITEARASLPAHRPTDRDWFKINGGE